MNVVIDFSESEIEQLNLMIGVPDKTSEYDIADAVHELIKAVS